MLNFGTEKGKEVVAFLLFRLNSCHQDEPLKKWRKFKLLLAHKARKSSSFLSSNNKLS